MKLKELIKDLDYRRLENINNFEVKGVSCNSDCIRPGYLFVAIKGEKNDGHNFAGQAVDRGAKAIIIQRDLPLKKIAKILVRDSRTALASVSASFFGHPSRRLKIIGITGTNGKTTVSYLLEKILACAGYPCGVIGTVNYRIQNRFFTAVNTTPSADILQYFLQEIVLAKSRYAIIEVSSHALAQGRVEAIDFSSAIFTNLSKEHLDYHGSLNNYFHCKSILFKKLSTHSWAIINTDDPFGRRLAKRVKSRLLTYGIEHAARIRAKNLRLDIEGSKFTVVTPKGDIEITTSLIGRHNVYNILAAIATAFVENIDFFYIVQGIKCLTSIPGRLERIDCGQDFTVFVDYAHTADALDRILRTLKQVGKNRVILVFGCGGDRDKAKRPAMGRVATRLSDFVILTNDNPRSENPRQIVSDILNGVDKKRDNYKVILDRFQAIFEAFSFARSKDIVVIAGKGHESSQVFANKTVPFNDREVAIRILQCLQSKRY